MEANLFVEDDCFMYKPIIPPALEIKELGGRWVPKRGMWKLPKLMCSVEGLKRLFPEDEIIPDEKMQALLDSPVGFHLLPEDTVKAMLPEETWNALLKHQKEAVIYMVSSPHKAGLLGLSPGLGKTLTALAAAYAVGAKRVLVISPLSLMYNWTAEASDWLGVKIERVYKESPTKNMGWVVTNYDTMVRHEKAFLKQSWDVIIVEESVLIQNHKAARTEAVGRLRATTKYMWELSGSPISKHADGLYGQFNAMFPKFFTSYWRFARTYCNVEPSKWGDRVVSTRRGINLRREFRDIMFIRNQKDVAKQLEIDTDGRIKNIPDLLFETVYADMTDEQGRVYNDLSETFIAMLESGEEMAAVNKVSQLIRLQQAVSNLRNFGENWPNESGKLEVLQTLLETGNIPFPTIIWTHWKEGAAEVTKMVKKLKLRVSHVKSGKPEDAAEIETFKQGKLDVLVLPLGVGKFGHTMVNAGGMVYFDKTWNADDYIQSLARVHRIGLQHSPVVTTLRCPGTVDDLIENILSQKAVSISSVSNADLVLLLRSLKDGSRSNR